MRPSAFLVCLLLVGVAVCEQIDPAVKCRDNYKQAVEQIKSIVSNKQISMNERFSILKQVAALAKDCLAEFADIGKSLTVLKDLITKKNRDAPLAASSLGATPQECDQWSEKIVQIEKLLSDPYTRTDRLLNEYVHLENLYQQECQSKD